MRRLAGALGLIALVAAGCGHDGATQYSGAPPDAETVYGQCAFCHGEIANSLLANGHGDLTGNCQSACHTQNLTPGMVGPGHYSVPACADCHNQQQMPEQAMPLTHHDPAAGTNAACQSCHTPHGSLNLTLILPQIAFCAGGTQNGSVCLAGGENEATYCPGGSCSAAQPIQLCLGGSNNVKPCFEDSDCPGGKCLPGFTNLLGKADFSLATATYPGHGICEVCHTTTRYYRSDGSGAEHFPYPCFTCHPHAAGFAPR